mgnify:CR=1 FL=1
MIKILSSFVLGVFLSSYVMYKHFIEEKHKAKITHERIVGLKHEIPERVYVIKPKDANRLEDCTDESYVYHGGRIWTHPFMKYFDEKYDPLNAFTYSYSPGNYIYHYFQGLSSIDEHTSVMIGLRGDTAGPHRSAVTKNLYRSVFTKFKNTMIYMPATFHAKGGGDLKNNSTVLQSICHRRVYDGQYIGSGWPGMSDGHSWQVVNSLLKDKAKLFVFAYSNGQIVQDDFFRTSYVEKGYVPRWASVSNAWDFMQEYDSKTKFINDGDVRRIFGVVDIETNYSGAYPIWDLGKFIKNHIDGDTSKIYYAACGIESPVAINHVKLIQALGLLGFEQSNGVVRYMNSSRNIIIDILTYNEGNPYAQKNVNLETQTIFLKDNNVGHRLSLGHYAIVPYVTDQFAKLAAERRILLD